MNEELIIRHLLAGSLKHKICRICFSEEDNLLPLDGAIDDHNVYTVKDMLLCISSLEIEDSESMPENVCQNCLETIHNSYKFRIQCEDADVTLNNCINAFCDQVKNISQDNPTEDQTILIILPEEKNELKQEKIGAELSNNHSNSEQNFFLDSVKKESSGTNPATFLNPIIDKDGVILNTLFKEVACDNFLKTNSVYKLDSNDYECSMCLEIFSSKNDFKEHKKNHSEDSRHICKICFKTYRKLSILKRHMVTHTGNKLYTCNICGKSYYHRNALKCHMRYHQDKRYTCKICDAAFYFKYMLVDHLSEEHPNELENGGDSLINIGEVKDLKMDDSHHCPMCRESFSNELELNVHKATHPEGTRYVCRVCDKSYIEMGTLNRHMIMHSGKKTHLCPVCGKSFYFKNVLKAHMVYHGDKKFLCYGCDKRFYTAHILREHVRLTHSSNKYNHICEVCGKLCSSQSRLAIHRHSHTKAFCSLCGKSYRNLRYFKEHMQRHKGAVLKKKEFFCDYCGEPRSLKTLLELHILSKHLKERRYKCLICGKGFFNKGSLNEHGIVHTKARPEQCSDCGRKLVNKKALILHQRLHTGEKPFTCNECGECFSSASRRTAHFKSRHGEKEQMCTICPEKFHLKSQLNRHLLEHTRQPKINLEDIYIAQN